MLSRNIRRATVGLSATALLFSAAVLPAQADPAAGTFGTLVGLGSDTTQDVLNGLAAAIPGQALASYDATGSATVITRQGGAAVPRANGSGAGVGLLRAAIGQSDPVSVGTFSGGTVSVTTASAIGLVDFARSSSGAGSNAVDNGVLAYVPFALDAVTYAVSPTSVLPSNLTKAQLTSIYKGEINRVAYASGQDSQLLSAGDPVPAGFTAVTITTFIPQAGSGTRSYWLGEVGITESDISSNTYPNLRATDLGGADVQEHKGAALITGTTEQQKATIVPFSIAQWVSQANAKVADHRDGALIGSVNGIAPVTGSGTNYALNSAFNAYTRKVYNVVPSVLADDETSDIAKAFVGPNSLVCQQSETIASYGFGTVSDCGSTSVRAFAPSPSTLETSIPASATAGQPVTLRATVTSNGNGGGQVQFRNGSTVLATATVSKGASTAAATWTPAAAGNVAISAVFIPALPGVDASTTAAASVQVTAATTQPAATSVRLSASAKPTVGKNVTVTATITKPAVAGTVTFRDGSAVIGKPVAVAAAQNTAAVSFKATKTSHRVSATFTPASAAARASTQTLTVTAAKAKSTVKINKVKAQGKTATLTLQVKAAGVKPNGKIVVKAGKKKVATVKVKNGKKIRVKVAKLKRGKNKLTVSFNGSATVTKANAKTTVRVAR
ncbi:ABC-type phosphate transport system, substrate-binding protein [Micrococcales bacterium KH10]|nr:ABC-type phosphate transport system, substrate-binding protein [Micrococcales bacterium KH10]